MVTPLPGLFFLGTLAALFFCNIKVLAGNSLIPVSPFFVLLLFGLTSLFPRRGNLVPDRSPPRSKKPGWELVPVMLLLKCCRTSKESQTLAPEQPPSWATLEKSVPLGPSSLSALLSNPRPQHTDNPFSHVMGVLSCFGPCGSHMLTVIVKDMAQLGQPS